MLKKPQCPVIAIEEHYSDAELTALFTGRDAFAPPHVMKALADVGEARLKDMDASGIDVQVLSHSAPSLQKITSGAVELGRRVNDRLAAIIATAPKRFAGFAVLPTSDPAAAADELERCVTKLGFKGAMIHGLDRKSTRLNSSHVRISYAVFCLKKKKKKKKDSLTPTTENQTIT